MLFLDCLRLKIMLMTKWHVLGWHVLVSLKSIHTFSYRRILQILQLSKYVEENVSVSPFLRHPNLHEDFIEADSLGSMDGKASLSPPSRAGEARTSSHKLWMSSLPEIPGQREGMEMGREWVEERW